jgi:hypothetical protein
VRVGGAWMLAVLLVIVAAVSFALGYFAVMRFMG